MDLFTDLFWKTELELFGKLNADKPQLAMWKNLKSDHIIPANTSIELRSINRAEDWDTLFHIRKKIEIPFGVTKESTLKGFCDEIKLIVHKYKATWFMAFYNDQAIGEIGIVPFCHQDISYGRLLDVDIIPEFQGRGFGNQLLSLIFEYGFNKNLEGLCLKADDHNWVKNWYERLGFIPLKVFKPEYKLEI